MFWLFTIYIWLLYYTDNEFCETFYYRGLEKGN